MKKTLKALLKLILRKGYLYQVGNCKQSRYLSKSILILPLNVPDLLTPLSFLYNFPDTNVNCPLDRGYFLPPRDQPTELLDML